MGSWLQRLRKRYAEAVRPPPPHVPDDIEDQLPLHAIDKVTFFKRDLITIDLICCEVEAKGRVWFFHEDYVGWKGFVGYLEKLPAFRSDWEAAVVLPPMARCETVAYIRDGMVPFSGRSERPPNVA